MVSSVADAVDEIETVAGRCAEELREERPALEELVEKYELDELDEVLGDLEGAQEKLDAIADELGGAVSSMRGAIANLQSPKPKEDDTK